MPVTVRIPAPLRGGTSGQRVVTAEGTTVAEVIDGIDTQHPGFRQRVCAESGELRRFVNMYLRDEEVRVLGGLDAELQENDELSIVLALAGG